MSNRKRDKRAITMCGGLNAHKLVAEIAIGMAQELFEVYMRENDIYKRMHLDGKISKSEARKLFVSRVAPKFLEKAREVMTDMLSQPEDRVTQHMKDQIHEALSLDYMLRANRMVSDDQLARILAN